MATNSGQAALETALILPPFILVTLGVLQLGAIQQARIMTEYAAFQAARAGIVWNGSNERMRDAAILALLPTAGRTDGLSRLATTWAKFQATDSAIQQLPWITPVPRAVNGSPLHGLVRIDTLGPASAGILGSISQLRGGTNWQELDFDAPETASERSAKRPFPSLATADDSEAYRSATVLSIRVRYWYEMRIPVANWGVFLAWYASNAGVGLRARPANAAYREVDVSSVDARTPSLPEASGYDTAYPGEMRGIWSLATGQHTLPGQGARRFFIPLTATYSMRMQSNFYRKWIMHP